jgi:hypothetical protein
MSYANPDPAYPTAPWIVHTVSDRGGAGAHGLVPIALRSGPTFFAPPTEWHPAHLGPDSALNTRSSPGNTIEQRYYSDQVGALTEKLDKERERNKGLRVESRSWRQMPPSLLRSRRDAQANFQTSSNDVARWSRRRWRFSQALAFAYNLAAVTKKPTPRTKGSTCVHSLLHEDTPGCSVEPALCAEASPDSFCRPELLDQILRSASEVTVALANTGGP